MKKVLVIGSAVVDVVIRLNHLPKTSEDVHVLEQHMALGGCAYNASDIIRHIGVPYIPFFPVGMGTYGNFIREKFLEKGILSPIPTPQKENGCCYCFVEDSGERTFISYHGAEYLFEREWFHLLNPDEFDCAYLCGLEVEETTGVNIIEYLETQPQLTVYFAPGPRINKIEPEKLSRIFQLHPVLHLNESETLEYTKKQTIEVAAEYLFERIQNTVIVTLGANGAYYHSAEGTGYVPGVKATQVDTIGAGDSHIGAVIACLQKGYTLPDAIAAANKVSAAVVGVAGALLSDEEYNTLFTAEK